MIRPSLKNVQSADVVLVVRTLPNRSHLTRTAALAHPLPLHPRNLNRSGFLLHVY